MLPIIIVKAFLLTILDEIYTTTATTTTTTTTTTTQLITYYLPMCYLLTILLTILRFKKNILF